MSTHAVLSVDCFVAVERGEHTRPVDAVGNPGRRRTYLKISITDAGRNALAAA